MVFRDRNRMSTPSLNEVISRAIETRLLDVHTAMPGQIVSYNSSNQSCTVQLSIKKKYEDGTLINIPQITNVPVVFPRAGKAFISMPLKAGDNVLVIFSERAMDLFLNLGGIVDPKDPRKHHITDAIAIPGVYPFNNSIDASASALRIQNDQSRIDLFADGKFSIEKVGGDEFLDLVSQICDALTQSLTNTLLGPQPLLNAGTFASIKSKIDAIKGS